MNHLKHILPEQAVPLALFMLLALMANQPAFAEGHSHHEKATSHTSVNSVPVNKPPIINGIPIHDHPPINGGAINKPPIINGIPVNKPPIINGIPVNKGTAPQ
jgi:hypothetical protein